MKYQSLFFFNLDRWMVTLSYILCVNIWLFWQRLTSPIISSLRPDVDHPGCSDLHPALLLPVPCPFSHGQNHLSWLPKQARPPVIGDSFRSKNVCGMCYVKQSCRPSPAKPQVCREMFVRAPNTVYHPVSRLAWSPRLQASLALGPPAESHQTPDCLCGCQSDGWHLNSSERSGNESYRCACRITHTCTECLISVSFQLFKLQISFCKKMKRFFIIYRKGRECCHKRLYKIII